MYQIWLCIVADPWTQFNLCKQGLEYRLIWEGNVSQCVGGEEQFEKAAADAIAKYGKEVLRFTRSILLDTKVEVVAKISTDQAKGFR